MAVRNDFTAGEVLAAADLNDTFGSKVDYALPVNAQTGTAYTFVAADAEKLTTASNGSAVTLTIPPASSVAWPDETILRVVNYGAGAVTIDGGSGVTVTNTSSTVAQYGAAVAIRTGSDAWTVVPFGGGDVPSATVSSPAATGQYTDSGITYDYFVFNSSGTLTVDTAGFADILVVGGGGGGGRRFGGGGGAGGHVFAENVYLPSGNLQVRVGAGGAGGNAEATFRPSGLNGNSSGIGDFIVAPGGGGGGGSDQPGSNGGSGAGGGGTGAATGFTGGAGFAPQGNDGGTGGTNIRGGGGGGADAAGATGNASGNGGAGKANDITGSSVTRAGGGGAGSRGGTAGAGGAGGGGNGTTNDTTGGAGSANTGGGGGGGGDTATANGGVGGAGGSGVVIVRVKV